MMNSTVLHLALLACISAILFSAEVAAATLERKHRRIRQVGSDIKVLRTSGERKICVYDESVDNFLFYEQFSPDNVEDNKLCIYEEKEKKNSDNAEKDDEHVKFDLEIESFEELDYSYDYQIEPTERNDDCFYCDAERKSLKDGDLEVAKGALVAWTVEIVPTPNIIDINLKGATRVHTLKISVKTRDTYGLLAPETITVSFSMDGKTFFGTETFSPVQGAVGDNLEEFEIENFSGSCPCSVVAVARYIRVAVTCPSYTVAVDEGNVKCTIGEIEITGNSLSAI